MLTVLIASVLFIALTSFADVTGALVTAPGYATLTQAVRDLYSKEVLFLAQPRLRFAQFAKVKQDIQALKGKSIIFVKYGNLTGGGSLAESDTLVPAGMSTSQIQVPVSEVGNAVQVTEFLLRTSLLDVLGDASKLLANNFATVLDTQFKTTILAGSTNTVFGNGKTTAATLVTGDGLTTQTVKDVVELLATNNAPRFNDNMGEYYVCVAHPHQLRQLRDDPNWINANTYMGRRQLYVGEVGMYEGVIFIETTQMTPLTNAQAVAIYGTFAPTTGYQAVVFGENAYAWAIALPVELRDDGITEFGRKHAIAWYGIWGMAVIEPLNICTVLTA